VHQLPSSTTFKCIFARDFPGHISALRRVFTALREHGIRLKMSKCQFAKRTVDCLGVRVGEGKVSMATMGDAKHDASHAIAKWPVPTNAAELRSALGMFGYFRRFIRGFANHAAPLNVLLKKDVPWVWTAECNTAFEALRQALMTRPVLHLPNEHDGWVLETDASGFAIGGVLSQRDRTTGELRPISFYSRGMNDAERNYSTREQELLAIHACLSQWRTYFGGHRCTVYTDHASLQTCSTRFVRPR
jgi:RNase H-like domain found in reverse transcriptase